MIAYHTKKISRGCETQITYKEAGILMVIVVCL